MREILFRGVSTDSVEWVYGWFEMYPYARWPLKDTIIPSDEAEDGYFHHVEVIPETVGQFAGVTDKNGKKIFEGDIIIDDWGKIYEVIFSLESCSFVVDCKKTPVKWEKRRYRIDNAWSNTIRVIGNIHDNPELLEEE